MIVLTLRGKKKGRRIKKGKKCPRGGEARKRKLKRRRHPTAALLEKVYLFSMEKKKNPKKGRKKAY